MKQLKQYFKIVREIYDYFDYSSGRKIYPIEDYTEFYWKTNQNIIFYSDNKKDFVDDVFIEKHNGDEYVMFLVKDTHNLDDCLIIFDKKNQIKDE